MTYSEIYGAGGLVVQVLITPWMINKFGEKSALIFGLFVYIIYMGSHHNLLKLISSVQLVN